MKYYDPEGEAGELTLTWTSGAWWLVGADGPLPVGDLIFAWGVVVAAVVDGVTIYLKKTSKKSGKEKASDIPSWAKGKKPKKDENGKAFATRLCDERYGKGNYNTGAGSEYNQLKKYGDRGGK